jgi:dihydroorotate dehydrogenase
MPKYDLSFHPPVMNAAGSLGFAPSGRIGLDWSRFGAFVTNPISLGPRSPAHGLRFAPYPGGFLVHTGYPNPGFKAALKRYAAAWRRAPLPVIVHLLAQQPDELAYMVSRLEGRENLLAVEVGLPPGVDATSARLLVEAALGEMALIARLPCEQALELAPVALQAGAAAVSLEARHGTLPAGEGLVMEGRLYGPAVFPQAFSLTRQLIQAEIPVIAAGGVYREAEVEALLAAGALGVQLDASLWLEV